MITNTVFTLLICAAREFGANRQRLSKAAHTRFIRTSPAEIVKPIGLRMYFSERQSLSVRRQGEICVKCFRVWMPVRICLGSSSEIDRSFSLTNKRAKRRFDKAAHARGRVNVKGT